MTPQDLHILYGQAKESAERNNFESLWQDAVEWCNPKADSIQKKHIAGERKSDRRVIDIGIKSRRMFTAGMMSHLFPTGQNWLRVVTSDMEGDTVKAALNAVTTKFIDELNESNFYLEMGQSMGNFVTLVTHASTQSCMRVTSTSAPITSIIFTSVKTTVKRLIRFFALSPSLHVRLFNSLVKMRFLFAS